MTETSPNKPFYFRPPWNILFDLQMLERLNPWNINLSFLLLSFLEEMEKRTEVDFRASGMALGSSATVHLMKSELLLELEQPPPVPEPPSDFIPPPLILPLRYELTTTTIQNLLEALDNALKNEKLFTLKTTNRTDLLPPADVIPSISAYLMELEDQMEKLLKKMVSLTNEGKIITFSRLVVSLEKLDKIRNFIVLLFLAQKNKVTLWQEENSDEVFITVNGVKQ
jgi:chromatin segregation and condensation protein Rec8/ScpA/Scc1 (kleisin family)